MKAVVHKFGGVALANAEAIRHAVAIVAARRTHGVAVVVSAMGGVTDALLEIAALAKGRKLVAARRAIAALLERHVATADDLISDTKLLGELHVTIHRELDDLADLANRIAAPNDLTAAMTDRIAFGDGGVLRV